LKARSRQPIPAARVFGNPWCFLGFGFGSGLAPVAPGTFGTLAAVPIYMLLAELPMGGYAALVLVLLVAGIYICQRCEDILRVEDHPGIVWDEIVGYLITMSALPCSWQGMSLGFILFRVFDVLKPWPISRLDRTVHGGLGVMLDDVLAGIFAALTALLLRPYAGF
jgi:phosphatidylglycerophosphatase A